MSTHEENVHVTDEDIDTADGMDAIVTGATFTMADGEKVEVQARFDFPAGQGLYALQCIQSLQNNLDEVAYELAVRGDKSCAELIKKWAEQDGK